MEDSPDMIQAKGVEYCSQAAYLLRNWTIQIEDWLKINASLHCELLHLPLGSSMEKNEHSPPYIYQWLLYGLFVVENVRERAIGWVSCFGLW